MEHHVIKWKSMIGLGVLGAILGILILLLPAFAATLFVIIAGVSILILSGILLAEGLFIDTEGISKWVVFAMGIIGIVLGAVAMARPDWLILATGVLFGLYLVLFGIGEGVVGLSMVEDDMMKSMVVVMGIVSIVLGLLILLNPEIGVTIIAWLIGLFLLIFGLIRVAHGMALRKAEKKMTIKHL